MSATTLTELRSLRAALLTRQQVEEITTLSRSSLYRLAAAGELAPVAKLGSAKNSRVLWHVADVERWLRKHMRAGSAS